MATDNWTLQCCLSTFCFTFFCYLWTLSYISIDLLFQVAIELWNWMWVVEQLRLTFQYQLGWTIFHVFLVRQTVFSAPIPFLSFHFLFSFTKFSCFFFISSSTIMSAVLFSYCCFPVNGHCNKLAQYCECATEDEANVICIEMRASNQTNMELFSSHFVCVLFVSKSMLQRWVNNSAKFNG